MRKKCRECLEFKEVSEFYNDKTKKDGKQGICSACKTIKDIEYRYANRDRINDRCKKYYSENREKILSEKRKNNMPWVQRNSDGTFKDLGKYQYKQVYVRKGKNISEHRLVYEKEFGKIPCGYVVHHINGKTKDNRIENLIALPVEEHNRIHNIGRVPWNKGIKGVMKNGYTAGKGDEVRQKISEVAWIRNKDFVKKINDLKKEGKTYIQIATILNENENRISDQYRKWRHKLEESNV